MEDSEHDDAAIFKSLHEPLRRLAAVVGPWEVEPDDLVQEAVERTLRIRPLSDLEHPGAYLSRVIVNLAADHRRRLGRARRARSRIQVEVATDQIYPSDLDDLLRLPPKQRTVLYLSRIEGMSHSEIGELIGMTDSAVAKALERARKHLRIELEREMT